MSMNHFSPVFFPPSKPRNILRDGRLAKQRAEAEAARKAEEERIAREEARVAAEEAEKARAAAVILERRQRLLQRHYDAFTFSHRRVTGRQVIRETADKYGLSVNDLVGPWRHKLLCEARHEAMWRCRKETKLSFPQIGSLFGGRDHTSIMHAYRKVEAERARAGG